MAAKQFTLETRDCYNWGIWVVDIIKDNGIELPQSTVCDLLNKLTEEKQLLQEINEKQAQYNQRIDKILGEGGVILTKHQLKSLIEMKNDDESSEIRHLRTANARLKDEIIALREYIQKNEMK
ncbi:MAG: hypothetical protein IKF11_04575 [Methanobrevibacter sp.]|nr:hypothetical protein [Methanobrevibacter sp.]